MKNRFETCTVTLTPLSPIHISNGNSDYGWGAVWLQQSNKMIVLDSERFSQKLIEKDLLETYINEVERWTRLSDREKSDRPNPCYTFIERHARLFEGMTLNNFVESLKVAEYDAKPSNSFIRNGKGEAYISGSSIKGAIRTAVIYAILQEHKRRTRTDYLNNTYLKNKLSGKSNVPNTSNEGAAIRKGLDTELLEVLLEDFELSEKDDLGNPISTNLMRAILVSDSSPIPHVRKNLVPEEIKIIMLENEDSNGDRYVKQQTIQYATGLNVRECFEPVQNPTIQFKITIDHEILKSFNSQTSSLKIPIAFSGLKDLEKIIRTFYTKVWNAEELYFLNDLKTGDQRSTIMMQGAKYFYDSVDTNALPTINIGLGSGMLCKTLFIMMNEEYRAKIRNLQMTDLQIANHHLGQNKYGTVVNWDMKLSPNSRHLVFRPAGNAGNTYRPLGWANLKFGAITTEANTI